MREKITTYTGRGAVHSQDEWLADVEYRLDVWQEYTEARTQGQTAARVPGLKSIDGTLRVLKGDTDLGMGREDLVLRLDDGRSLRFYTRRHDLGASIHAVLGSGGFF